MRQPGLFSSTSFMLLAVILLILPIACGGPRIAPEPPSAYRKYLPENIEKLSKRYKNIVCYEFTSAGRIEKEYPGKTKEIQTSCVTRLKEMEEFEAVDLFKTGEEAGIATLLVKVDVSHMFIAPAFFSSPWVRSQIDLELKLFDGATKELIRQENMSHTNNPMSGYWTFGHTDRSLPYDVGHILAEYIAEAIPRNE